MDGSRNSRARHDAKRSALNSRTRRGCTNVVGSGGARRRETESPVVRFPGHDHNKPYNSYHRFEKVGLRDDVLGAVLQNVSPLRKGRVYKVLHM